MRAAYIDTKNCSSKTVRKGFRSVVCSHIWLEDYVMLTGDKIIEFINFISAKGYKCYFRYRIKNKEIRVIYGSEVFLDANNQYCDAGLVILEEFERFSRRKAA